MKRSSMACSVIDSVAVVKTEFEHLATGYLAILMRALLIQSLHIAVDTYML